MNEMEYEKLLEEHGIKPTANRILVVKALASSMQPLSLAELERRIMTMVMGRATNSATVMTTTTTRISIPISSVRYVSRRIVWTI